MNLTYQTPSLNVWKRSWSEMGSSKSPSPRFPRTSRQDGDGVGKRDYNPCRAELWAQCSPTRQELKPVLAEALLSPSSSDRVQTVQRHSQLGFHQIQGRHFLERSPQVPPGPTAATAALDPGKDPRGSHTPAGNPSPSLSTGTAPLVHSNSALPAPTAPCLCPKSREVQQPGRSLGAFPCFPAHIQLV